MPASRSMDGYGIGGPGDRKSTRLNSSHSQISYAVFCLKKKKKVQVARKRYAVQQMLVVSRRRLRSTPLPETSLTGLTATASGRKRSVSRGEHRVQRGV